MLFFNNIRFQIAAAAVLIIIIFDYFICKHHIVFSSGRFWIIFNYRHSITWCFCQTYISGNHSVIDMLIQIFFYIFYNLHRKICS